MASIQSVRGRKPWGVEQITDELGFTRPVLPLRMGEPEAKEGWQSRWTAEAVRGACTQGT